MFRRRRSSSFRTRRPVGRFRRSFRKMSSRFRRVKRGTSFASRGGILR